MPVKRQSSEKVRFSVSDLLNKKRKKYISEIIKRIIVKKFLVIW